MLRTLLHEIHRYCPKYIPMVLLIDGIEQWASHQNSVRNEMGLVDGHIQNFLILFESFLALFESFLAR